ncbi:MAG: 50S ribosomal protein L15, partial [Chloroflexota bacterium]
LKPSRGANKARKRVGRGSGSGTGTTAGRGTKGQLARSGGRVRPGFEGGQNPIYRRMPYKRGFKSPFKTQYEVINLRTIVELELESPITPESLFERGVTRSLDLPVKILGDGDVTSAYTIRAHKFSKSAQEKIEAAGGTVEVIE